MKKAWVLYAFYFVLWTLSVFANPWADVRLGAIPLYIWLTCLALPLGFSAVLGLFAWRSRGKRAEVLLATGSTTSSTFFLGSRTSAFLLAMSLVATYVEGSTFLAGPSVALDMGFSWVLLASVQLPNLFLVIAVLGERFVRLRRKFSFLTLLDLLKARYPSRALFYLFMVALALSLLLTIVIQLMAAGRIMESILGFNYTLSLFVFLLVIAGYTLIGGFRHVVATDVLQVGLMLVFVVTFGVVLFWSLGESTLVESLSHKSDAFFDRLGAAAFSQSFLISLWILLGIGFLGSPAITSRLLSLTSVYQIPSMAFWSTFIISLLVIGIHGLAALGAGFATDLPANDTAWITLIGHLLGRGGEVIFSFAPLMAIMSTIDTLILIFASLLWSLWQGAAHRIGKKEVEVSSSRGRVGVILGSALVVFAFALYPPDFLVWLKLFSLGIGQVVFFAPLFLGLWDLKGNNGGVWAAVITGLLAFVGWHWGLEGSTQYPHAIVAGLGVSVIAYWTVSRLVPSTALEQVAQEQFREALSD